MSVKSKVGGFATLIAIVVAVAFGSHLFDPSKSRDKDWVLVNVKVTFEPAVRDKKIAIVITVDSSGGAAYTATQSPWLEQVSVRRGSSATLIAVQPTPGPYMDCMLFSANHRVGPVPAKPTNDGKSACVVEMVAA